MTPLANVIEGVRFRMWEREVRAFARAYKANVRRCLGARA